MKRKIFPKRHNYQQKNEEVGFDFSLQENGTEYWNEAVGYEFTSKEIDLVEKSSKTLHQMCFSAIDNIIQKDRFKELNIDPKMIPYIKKSWSREDWLLTSRMDFVLKDGKVKLLEINGDTPTSLVESTVVQWNWKEEQVPNSDQYNSAYEKMVDWWKAYQEEFNPEIVHFTTIKENSEDYRTVELTMNAAQEAGVNCQFIFIEDLGSDGDYFYDMEKNQVKVLYALYPKEWMFIEKFADVLIKDTCKIINPPWVALLSTKAILPILYELFPNSEYLLPTYFSPEKLGPNYVKKPFLSREGQNVTIVTGETEEAKDGLYASEYNIYQEFCELPKFKDENGNDVYVVVGAWIVGEEPAGMGLRESNTKITANLSKFCSHYIANSKPPKNTKTIPWPKAGEDHFIDKNGKPFKFESPTEVYSEDTNKYRNLFDQDETTRKSEEIKNMSFDNALSSLDRPKKSRPSYEPPSSSEKLEKAMVLFIPLVIIIAALAGIYGIISFISSENQKTEAHNAEVKAFNSKQTEALAQVFSVQKQNEAKAWINDHIDSKNREVYNSILKMTHDLVEVGINSKEKFMEIDKALSTAVFCIQGAKDISNFQIFMDYLVLETPKQAEMITYLKNKYNYESEKIEVPSEEKLLGICKFENFEKDLDQVVKSKNVTETDPKKKVVIEDGEGE